MQKAYFSSFGSRVLRGALLGLTMLVLLAGARTATLGQVGKVWAWGWNDNGQLGDGSNTNRTAPVQATGLTGVVQLEVGAKHSLALKSDGKVWAWGRNASGQLGDGTTVGKPNPFQIPLLSGIVQVAAGSYHSLALKSDGTVWAWGWNASGQLGDGTTTNNSTPRQVQNLTGIVQITAGGHYEEDGAHNLALKSDGTVWAWGWNKYGELGDNTTTKRLTPTLVPNLTGVMRIVAGAFHSIALKSDGTVWVWGRNDFGQLGDDTTANKLIPVQVKKLTGIVQIAGGAWHSFAIKSDGTVWAWGGNSHGQLGDGTTTERHVPVPFSVLSGIVQVVCGDVHSLALRSDGTVWAWGYNHDGELGDGTTTDNSTPRQVSPLTLIGQTSLATGEASFHSLSVQAVVLNTTLKPANVTAAYGKSFTLSSTLKNALGGVLINEPVAFMVDGTDVGSAKTDVAGKAVVLVPASLDRHPGAYKITASYAGNRLYANSSKDSTLTITKADTVIIVPPIIGTPGVTKTLSATLKSKSDASALSARTLTFKIDGNVIGTASTDGTGKAILSYKFDETYAVGAHTLTAEYDGSADADYNSSSGTAALTINQAASKIVGSSAIGKAGTTVTLIAVLTRTSDKAALVGRTVSFVIDGATVGKAVTDSDGFALFDYAIPSTMTTGLHPLAVSFKGDALYIKSSDNTAWLKVR